MLAKQTSTTVKLLQVLTQATSRVILSALTSWEQLHPLDRFGKRRVRFLSSLLTTIFSRLIATVNSDILLNAIGLRSREILPTYGQDKLLDPAVLLTLPDEVKYGANLFGFQKVYEGKWSVDVFFDSDVSPAQLDGAQILLLAIY